MTHNMPSEDATAVLADAIHPFAGKDRDYDPLIALIGEARVVLLGEASHGTHEFYRERVAITERLIREKGFTAVAVEADWPDAYRVNCYVRGTQRDGTAAAALSGFKRFPAWMWRNQTVLEFIERLRRYNDSQQSDSHKVGFYGLDLYSLHTSMEAVLRYLDKVDPEAARQARDRYACFEQFGEDPQEYGYGVNFRVQPSCEQEVAAQLGELQRKATEYEQRDGGLAEDQFFYAEQNARLAKNAEDYYRTMFRGHVESWNVRDCHMAESLDALINHLDRHGRRSRVVVWAHNSHLGDARATEMGWQGEVNLGQLVRERYPNECVSIGFSTYTGTVTAATDWGGPAEQKRVRPALDGSYEQLFHAAGVPSFLLPLRGDGPAAEVLREHRLERAIGVIYRPETERRSHYFYARLPDQFDAVIHLDQTTAVQPLERRAPLDVEEVPETFPSGQ